MSDSSAPYYYSSNTLEMAAVKFLVLVLLVIFLRLQRGRGEQEFQDGLLQCPPWFLPEGDSCVCGDGFGGLILCTSAGVDHNASLSIASFTCMTYDEELNTTVFGASIYTPGVQNGAPLGHYSVPVTYNASYFNDYICGQLNMEGRLCGRCKDGYSLQFHTHTPMCIPCNGVFYFWMLFFVRSILPTTILYVGVLFFKVDINRPPAISIIMFSQLYYYVFASNLDAQIPAGPLSVIARTVNSFYGVLNLQYFYELLTPTCLPGLTTAIQLLSFTYILGVYPLLLVVLTYICIELHARFRLIVILCKPFSICLAKLRRPYHASESVINALATFLVLSYTKMLLYSLFILQPVVIHTPTKSRISSLYFYYNPSIQYFHGNHLPAAVAAIIIGLFLLLPPTLLFFYPYIWFQELLERLRIRRHGLQAFMDIFQGHFKNGTEGTRDWRLFSTLYFVIKILIVVAAFSNPTLTLVTYAQLIGLVLIATVCPYKRYAYNVLESVIFAYYTALAHLITQYYYTVEEPTLIIIVLLYITPGLCFTGYFIFLLFNKTECVSLLKNKIVAWSTRKESCREQTVQEDIPYRLEHSSSFSLIETPEF